MLQTFISTIEKLVNNSTIQALLLALTAILCIEWLTLSLPLSTAVKMQVIQITYFSSGFLELALLAKTCTILLRR